MRKKLFGFFIFSMILILASGILVSCKKKDDAVQTKKERVFAVITQKASVSTVQHYIDINAEVECKTNVEIYPEISGKVVQLDVEVGDKVEKNQVIAYIDPSKPGFNYAKSPVKSTISGTVTKIISRVGASVAIGTGIVTVGDVDNLVLYADIPERDIGELKENLFADVFFPAYPEEAFKAHIVRISPVVDPDSRSKEIELSFERKDSRINSGMFPKVRLYTTVYSGRIVVPDDSIVTRAGQDYVYVAKKDDAGADIASRVPIKSIITVDGRTVISEGLVAGDEIVVDGMDALIDGAKINIMRK